MVQFVDELGRIAQIPPGQPQVGANQLLVGFGMDQGHGHHSWNDFADRLAATQHSRNVTNPARFGEASESDPFLAIAVRRGAGCNILLVVVRFR